MKKIIIIVLVIIVAGGLYFGFRKSKVSNDFKVVANRVDYNMPIGGSNALPYLLTIQSSKEYQNVEIVINHKTSVANFTVKDSREKKIINTALIVGENVLGEELFLGNIRSVLIKGQKVAFEQIRN